MNWTTRQSVGKKPWILTKPLNDGMEDDEQYSFASKKQRDSFIEMLKSEGRLSSVKEEGAHP